MFKQVIQDRILQVLQDYIQDFDNDFTFDLLSTRGEMKISRLRIREDALKSLQLPIRLKSGWVSDLHMLIPLNLKREPVQVSMEEVYLVVGPTSSDSFDYDLYVEGQQKAKKDLINNAESAEDLDREQDAINAGIGKAGEKKQESMMLQNVFDNLQVSIKFVHIRFEDDFTEDEKYAKKYAFGATTPELNPATHDTAKLGRASRARGMQRLTA